MGTQVRQILGQLHIITGQVIYNAGVPAIANCNDPTVTVADTGAGNFTLNIGHAFLSLPVAFGTFLKATHVTGVMDTVIIEQCTTGVVEMRVHAITTSAPTVTDIASPDPATGDGVSFIIIGMRDN